MNNYLVALTLLMSLFIGVDDLSAQSFSGYKKRLQSEFNQYKSDRVREFKDYRDRINSEFAEYMRRAWPKYASNPAESMPDSPEPPKPVIKRPDTPPSAIPIPYDEVKPSPRPHDPPQPVVPLPNFDRPVVPKPDVPAFSFAFYGTKCEMPLDDSHRFFLADATENAFADGWMTLSADRYLPVVAKCLDFRDKLRLCDWGYVRFVEQMTAAFFQSSKINEARLMQMYILTQSGYKVRIARIGDKLVLLLPSDDVIYGYTYLKIDGTRYYVMDKSQKRASLYVFNRKFPKEQDFSLRIGEQPVLAVDETVPRHLASEHNKELAADVSINKNLIAFYNDYPLSGNWNVYTNASLSALAKKTDISGIAQLHIREGQTYRGQYSVAFCTDGIRVCNR